MSDTVNKILSFPRLVVKEYYSSGGENFITKLSLVVNIFFFGLSSIVFFKPYPPSVSEISSVFILLIPILLGLYVHIKYLWDPNTNTLSQHHTLSVIIIGNLSYIIFFVAYSITSEYSNFFTSQYTYFFFCASFVVLLAVFWVIGFNIYITIGSFNSKSLKNDIRREMTSHPGVSLILFMSLFLSITFLLSFSFSFYNSYYWESFSRPALETNESFVVDKNKNVDETTARILFQPDSAELEVARPNVNTKPNPGSKHGKDKVLKIWNREAFNYVCPKLKKITSPGNNFNINIVGHTSDNPPSYESNFETNYGLGEARARETMLHIFECASKFGNSFTRNISDPAGIISSIQLTIDSKGALGEYHQDLYTSVPLFEPSNNGKSKFESHYKSYENKPDTSKSAEIIINELSPSTTTAEGIPISQDTSDMNLLDYIYFTTYTITTTGYGDIRPVVPMAKLITIIANMMEVLFIAIFFNLFLAFIINKNSTNKVETYWMRDKLFTPPPWND